MQGALTRWTAVFADPRQEAAFRQMMRPTEQATLRAAAAIVFLVDLLTVAQNKLVHHHPMTTTELVTQATVLTIAASLYFILGRPWLEPWPIYAVVCSLMMGIAIAVAIAFGYDMEYRGGMLIPSGVLVTYLVMRLDLPTLIWLAIAYTIFTFTAWFYTLSQPRPSEIGFMITLMILGHLLGFSEARRTQRERRTVFAQEQTLTQLATRDDLTNLGNRRYFYEAVDERLPQAGEAGTVAGIMLVDLDRFKEINDTLGHHVGDILLKEIAARMRRVLVHAPVLARLGGDEFAALLVGLPEDGSIVAAAQQFLAALDEPVELDGLSLQVHASIGVSLRRQTEDRQTLMKQADIAMYCAKRRGGGIELFSPEHSAYTRARVELASELAAALQTEQITLYFQPKTHISSGATEVVEALIRWQHPQRGLLVPAEFLPVAERHGMMRKLTLRVLELALRQAAQWHDAGRELRIAVNLAPESLLDLRFPDDVADLLAHTRGAAAMLQLEITETTLLVDPDRLLRVVTRLGESGFKFALDDYGTGYSSLAHLSLLPIDELKIDRTFVSNLVVDDKNAVIVRSTIEMAHQLGFDVVAEGVEDLATWQQLLRFGCDAAQGFYLSPPVPATTLEAWIDRRQRGLPPRAVRAGPAQTTFRGA